MVSIGDGAFDDCSGLTSVTIPNSVLSIGHWAFHRCSSITSLLIGDNVSSIGYNALSSAKIHNFALITKIFHFSLLVVVVV